MLNLAKLAAAAAALSSAASVATAQPVDWSAYDASRAQTVADQLVLCDLSAYLATSPDQDANRIYVQRDDRRFDPLIPPYVSAGGQWYDEDLERAYRRYRSKGLISFDQLVQSQDRYVRDMTRVFEDASVREQRFLEGQRTFCRDLARNAPR